MKEVRFFYDPLVNGELPQEEAKHATRVLRLSQGDELLLMDGNGSFFRAEITVADNHRCLYRILETMPQERAWEGHIHLAMAPTKLNDRVEWFADWYGRAFFLGLQVQRTACHQVRAYR